ncbi:hypothetical protein ACFY9A_19315 [Streptomyces rubradiris]|uniref:hypothetical protein n=1 Tax=Streptomyces rubradiris TaxID=285531 RepID=UPI0036E8BC3D
MPDRLRRLTPADPPDPRSAPVVEPVTASTAVNLEDLAGLAEACGPAAAAAVLAEAEDAGPAILNTLVLPERGAFSLVAAAVYADRPGAFPGATITGAVTAALVLRRALDRPAVPGQSAAAAGTTGCSSPARPCPTCSPPHGAPTPSWTATWSKDIPARLHALAAELAPPAAAEADGDCDHATAPAAACLPAGGCEDGGASVRAPGEPERLGSGPRVRGPGQLLEDAVHQARAQGEKRADVLHVTWRAHRGRRPGGGGHPPGSRGAGAWRGGSVLPLAAVPGRSLRSVAGHPLRGSRASYPVTPAGPFARRRACRAPSWSRPQLFETFECHVRACVASLPRLGPFLTMVR